MEFPLSFFAFFRGGAAFDLRSYTLRCISIEWPMYTASDCHRLQLFHMHAYTYSCMHAHGHEEHAHVVHTLLCACVHMCKNVQVQVCLHACMYPCICACRCECMHVSTIYICMCTCAVCSMYVCRCVGPYMNDCMHIYT